MNLIRILALSSLAVISQAVEVMYTGRNNENHHPSLRRKLPVGLLTNGKPIGNPNAKPGGLDLGRLSLDHWAWNICGGDGDGDETFAFFLDECAGQVGVPKKYFFIAGFNSQDGGGRTCEVPKNDFILIPIVNTICSDDDVDPDCEDKTPDECLPIVTDYCASKADPIVATKALLDGKDVSKQVARLQGGDAEFVVPCPNDWAGVTGGAGDGTYAADGLWLTIPPLSKGTHTVELAGNDGDEFELDFKILIDAV